MITKSLNSQKQQTLLGDRGAEDHGPLLVVQSEPGVLPEIDPRLYRLVFVQASETDAVVDGVRLPLVKGEMLALSPTERLDMSSDAAVLAIGFHHNFFCIRVHRHEVFCDGVVFNRLLGRRQIGVPEADWWLISSRFTELYQILQSGGGLMNERAVSCLRLLLVHMADCKLRGTASGSDRSSSPMLSDDVLRFQDMLEQHFREGRSVNFYSDAIGVSAATLNRRLKDEIGRTVKQAINERIAIEARVLLRSGTMSITEAAEDLGFDDPLYFSRFFKAQFGHSPRKYFEISPQVLGDT